MLEKGKLLSAGVVMMFLLFLQISVFLFFDSYIYYTFLFCDARCCCCSLILGLPCLCTWEEVLVPVRQRYAIQSEDVRLRMVVQRGLRVIASILRAELANWRAGNPEDGISVTDSPNIRHPSYFSGMRC